MGLLPLPPDVGLSLVGRMHVNILVDPLAIPPAQRHLVKWQNFEHN
jgi:hypothetical protein